ncbi:MAG: helix-turn-helix transcriptional regulator [Ruminococcaceae bacterium]|nr:helix-turn-helix transcriptional regulator [Oscillospiraceae bacterium]
MTYSEKIVKLRKANGYSQETFAKAVGVSRQAVYKWESGISYPEAEKLIEIKKLLGIKIDDLLDDSYEVVVEKKPVEKKKAAPEKTEEQADTVAEETAAPVETEAEVKATEPQHEVAAEEKKEAERKDIHAEQSKTAPKKQQNGIFGGFVSGLFGRRKK